MDVRNFSAIVPLDSFLGVAECGQTIHLMVSSSPRMNKSLNQGDAVSGIAPDYARAIVHSLSQVPFGFTNHRFHVAIRLSRIGSLSLP